MNCISFHFHSFTQNFFIVRSWTIPNSMIPNKSIHHLKRSFGCLPPRLPYGVSKEGGAATDGDADGALGGADATEAADVRFVCVWAPGTQMTLVLIGKDLEMAGKTQDKWVPGRLRKSR